jgi:hypothetical protein
MRANCQRRGWARLSQSEAVEKTQLHRRSKAGAMRLGNGWSTTIIVPLNDN